MKAMRFEDRLTERDCRKIRELRKLEIPATLIAQRFGVNTFTIYRILRGQR